MTEAIDSVLSQWLQDLERIVEDDGSTDATREIAARFRDRVVYLHQANSGPGRARNSLHACRWRQKSILLKGLLSLGEPSARKLAQLLFQPPSLARRTER